MSELVALRSDSPESTARIGAVLGAALRPGDVLVLEGPLGAGKTCLVGGIVAGAGGAADGVRSPTFVLHQPHRGTALTVHHVDLYRLGPGASVDFLDLDALLGDGAAVIEWGGYAELRDLQPSTVWIEADDDSPANRVLRLQPGGARHLEEAWTSLAPRSAPL